MKYFVYILRRIHFFGQERKENKKDNEYVYFLFLEILR